MRMILFFMVLAAGAYASEVGRVNLRHNTLKRKRPRDSTGRWLSGAPKKPDVYEEDVIKNVLSAPPRSPEMKAALKHLFMDNQINPFLSYEMPLLHQMAWDFVGRGQCHTHRDEFSRFLGIIAKEYGWFFARCLVNMPDAQGRSLAYYLVTRARKHAAYDMLLEIIDRYGLSLNTPDVDGNTLLHHAAYHGLQRLVQDFLDCGANPVQVNKYGKTAAEVADSAGHPRVALLLRFAQNAFGELL